MQSYRNMLYYKWMACRVIKIKSLKECIPVGCVPTPDWPYPIVSLPGGGSALPLGMLTPSEGRPPPPEGRPPQRADPHPQRADPPQKADPQRADATLKADPPEGDPPQWTDPPCGQTDACENITFPHTSYAVGKKNCGQKTEVIVILTCLRLST